MDTISRVFEGSHQESEIFFASWPVPTVGVLYGLEV